MAKILIMTGDGGEVLKHGSRHRFQEAGYDMSGRTVKRRLHLVMHDFEPGWDTYKESPGYAIESTRRSRTCMSLTKAVLASAGVRRSIPQQFPGAEHLSRVRRQGKMIFAIRHGAASPPRVS